MHDGLRYLDLALPLIPVGKSETPYNLSRFLYKGGASIRTNHAEQAIKNGLLGNVDVDRSRLIRLIHEHISGNLAGGGSPRTARSKIWELSQFFDWADKTGESLILTEVLNSYLNWSEHLLDRVRVNKDLNQRTIYTRASLVGQVLDDVLGRTKPILRTTRIKRPRSGNTSQSGKANKQNLNSTFSLGRLLQDICDGTSLGVIWSAPHVRIPLHQGGEIEYTFNYKFTSDKRQPINQADSRKRRLAYETNRSLNHGFRKSLINLRIQAELLMFIGQTGMNLAQAQTIPLRRFSYSSDINGYKVREYKPRRKGEVLFEIFSEYRSHFERYLDWRRQLFPDTEAMLFPLMRRSGTRIDRPISFLAIQVACRKAGIPWTPASSLRSTRVNWLLRRSGDPDLTSEMAQHSKKVLLEIYEKPSQQRAVTEITKFHYCNDPALFDKALMIAVAPGECDGIPRVSPLKPETASEPDCMRPSGCLWCEHHRDIDSLDYVWSLACFRHLKVLELSKQLPMRKTSTAIHPADHVIQRLGQKLSWFQESNIKRREWVEESLARVEEGYYHDQWSYLIESQEGFSK